MPLSAVAICNQLVKHAIEPFLPGRAGDAEGLLDPSAVEAGVGRARSATGVFRTGDGSEPRPFRPGTIETLEDTAGEAVPGRISPGRARIGAPPRSVAPLPGAT